MIQTTITRTDNDDEDDDDDDDDDDEDAADLASEDSSFKRSSRTHART